ncbi:methionyl-tRNA formyltransferase [Halobacterium salinarum]|uniref:methionyl-tRNA formyltransferase n=1 Tax=Halobacterium salinarum TaxID=2242 RepID=UPI002552DE9F|nr:formyltransferase family protein [Halobacterium salinarum]MDL0132502.1 formyltransferase family protein [Halobacterium salinarum]
MGENTDVVFLGVNDAGMRVYDWLCDQSGVFVHSLLTTKEQLGLIEDIQPDFVISCGYQHIVPEDILDIPTEGCLNLHPAYLPFNRGANPNVWSIVEGTPAGVTLHWMDAGIDTGNIIARQTVETSFTDDGRDLHERLEEAQVELFQEIWPDVVSGNTPEIKQNAEEGTYHRTDEFEELCKLDPDETVRIEDFLNRLRALTFPPHDNAEIEIEGETHYVEVDITK